MDYDEIPDWAREMLEDGSYALLADLEESVNDRREAEKRIYFSETLAVC